MGRPKLVDKYRVMEIENGDDVQVKFQQYLEKRIEMIANYVRTRWGVKPNGLLDAVELSSVQTSWGNHYVLNIIVPHNIERAYEIERAIVKYATRIVPVQEMISVRIHSTMFLQHDADMISIEAKFVLIAIPE